MSMKTKEEIDSKVIIAHNTLIDEFQITDALQRQYIEDSLKEIASRI